MQYPSTIETLAAHLLGESSRHEPAARRIILVQDQPAHAQPYVCRLRMTRHAAIETAQRYREHGALVLTGDSGSAIRGDVIRLRRAETLRD